MSAQIVQDEQGRVAHLLEKLVVALRALRPEGRPEMV